jgi:hypothetical protein
LHRLDIYSKLEIKKKKDRNKRWKREAEDGDDTADDGQAEKQRVQLLRRRKETKPAIPTPSITSRAGQINPRVGI